MNHTRHCLFLFSLIFFVPFIVIGGGSTYSRYNLGDLNRYGDSRLYAIGGTGIALVDDGFINGLNPAGLARISRTRFSGGFEYNRFSSKDYKNSSTYSNGGFQGLSFAFPISIDNGIVFSLGAVPYSTSKFAIDYTHIDNITGLNLNQKFYGTGGISELGLSLSGSIYNTLHVGGRFSYLFGRTRLYQTIAFENSDFLAINIDESTYYSGFAFTFGTIYENISELLDAPSLRNLTIGLTFSFGATLDVDRQSVYSSIDSLISETGTAKIPLSLGFGLSYLLRENQRVLADIYFENWANAKQFAAETGNLRNALRASIGFESAPAKLADTYLKRVTYRAGFAYNSTYYKINNNGINEYLICAGIGLPLGPESQLNLGFQIGLRGSTDNKLQKDTILRFSAAVSASELWFIQFDEE